VTESDIEPRGGAARAVLPMQLRAIAARTTAPNDHRTLTAAAAAIEAPPGYVELPQHEKVVRFFSESEGDHRRHMDGMREQVEDALRRALEAEESLRRIRAAAVVAHKGPHDSDASMLHGASKNLDHGYELGGGNLTRVVSRLLSVVADVLVKTQAVPDHAVDNASRPWDPTDDTGHEHRYASGGYTGERPTPIGTGSACYRLTAADTARMGLDVDPVHDKLRNAQPLTDKTPALAEGGEVDPTDDCD